MVSYNRLPVRIVWFRKIFLKNEKWNWQINLHFDAYTVSSVPLQPIVSNENRLVPTENSMTMVKNGTDNESASTPNEKATQKRINDKTCDTCGKSFPTSIKLSRHMKTHSQIFTHICKICHKGFTHGGNFKVHMRMHNDERVKIIGTCQVAPRSVLSNLKFVLVAAIQLHNVWSSL